MEKIKCITFDKAAQDVLPEQIKAKMKANMSKARREEYKKLCYNFEYKFDSNIPHCAKKRECDEDCEYMRNFKE
jgi:hypothetical protein|nr:MAG TPA: hypothetical protein [Bacteriophage sp.]